jgi:uncharacterized membrane protein
MALDRPDGGRPASPWPGAWILLVMIRRNAQLERNIAELLRQRSAEVPRSALQRFSDRATAFVSSAGFLVVQTVFCAAWCGINLGVAGWPAFDPFPFPMLTLLLSIEAIYLTALVLISQRTESELADARSELDLHINLLDERESTRVLRLVDAIARQVGVDVDDPDLADLEEDIDPSEVMEELKRSRC